MDKICKICGQTKLVEEFPKNGSSRRGQCKTCWNSIIKDYSKNYRQKNRDTIYARHKDWVKNNQEKAKAHYRKYYEKNKEEVKARTKSKIQANREIHNKRCSDYIKRNPEKYAAIAASRRAKKLLATPSWANTDKIKELYKIAKIKERRETGKWHVDHIVPLKSPLVCGLHCEANLQIISERDNKSKNNRHWPDMW